MSNIVIFVDDNDASASALMELKNATGRSLIEIRSAVENATPVVEREIFDESYDEYAAMLRRVVGSIEALGLTHRIYELPEGETMDTCDFVDNATGAPSGGGAGSVAEHYPRRAVPNELSGDD